MNARFSLVWPFRLFLAYLFLTASLGGWSWNDGGFVRVEGKLADPQRFLFQIRDLDLLSDPWNAWLAMGLPWLELVTGIALLIPWTALGGAVMASALMTLFLTALISASARGMEVECGCFGGPGGASETGMAIFWRAIWLGMALTCLVALWKNAAQGKPGATASPNDSDAEEGSHFFTQNDARPQDGDP